MDILFLIGGSVILSLRFTPRFFLAEKTYNKDLEVHSVALVHPNFAYGKTSLNSGVIFQ